MPIDLFREASPMMSELEAFPEFLPSAFWRDINKKNLEMLASGGIGDFKRTVSQNYYSWLIVDALTPQFRHVLKDWLRHPTSIPLFTTIERDVTVRTTTRPDRVRLSALQRFLYRLYVSCVWQILGRLDSENLAARVSEPEIGNPIRVRRNGAVITQDLANSILETNLMMRFLAPMTAKVRIAELGAGSGRLAHVFSATQLGTYHIFDIPPALIVSQWYLEQVLPGKRFFKFRSFETFDQIQSELAESDVAFFTSNQLAKFPAGYFDMVVSISTLPEMRPEQVTLFLDLFQKVSKHYIYIKQWRRWSNAADGTTLAEKDYVLDPRWEVVLDQVDAIMPLFFNRVWRRNEADSRLP